MVARVTIGVPVFRGERFLQETLRSIQSQTYEDFRVIMSIDGPDNSASEAICSQFLIDRRFELFIQPQRLGWVGNFNWLISKVDTEFWYYHQQDDLTHATYLEVLLNNLDRSPTAALVSCDVVPMGRITTPFQQEPPVLGATAFIRQMTMLHRHLVAFPLRGLIRQKALKTAGPMPTNEVNNYGVDITFLTGLARWGELQRVPLGLYWKRYHGRNTESAWWAWPREKRLEVWPHHCVDMLNQVLRISGSVPELRLLWLAAAERLTSPATARTFVDLSGLPTEDYQALLHSFLELAEKANVHDIPHLLDADWPSIRTWTEAIYWIPSEAPVDIVAFGPHRIEAGRPFNRQSDGRSAIWLRTSRAVRPGAQIRLGDEALETVISGTIATGIVPKTITAKPGTILLVLVDRNARRLSNEISLKVFAATSDA